MKKVFFKNMSVVLGMVMVASTVQAGGGQIGSAGSSTYQVDWNRIERAHLSDIENNEIYGRSFAEYFDGSCQKDLVIDLSALSSQKVKEHFKKQIEAKGHRAMLDSRSAEFPLKTIYFTNGTKVLRAEDQNQTVVNNEKFNALLEKLQSGKYEVSMKDLEAVLLSDQDAAKLKFKTFTQVSARVKTMLVPQDIMEAADAAEAARQKIYRETGSVVSVESILPGDDLVNGEAFTHGQREVSGLEFKKMQLLNLQVAMKQTKGTSFNTHMGDLTAYVIIEALLSPQMYSTEVAEAQSLIQSLPTCK